MEFVGNQINLKSVLATLTVAFFVGRIQLFDGTFPAAIALITVMAAVSKMCIRDRSHGHQAREDHQPERPEDRRRSL